MAKKEKERSWRFKDLPAELQEKIWQHAFNQAKEKGALVEVAGGWYTLRHGLSVDDEPGRPPWYDTSAEALVFFPDKRTVIDLEITTALGGVDDRARLTAGKECDKLAPAKKSGGRCGGLFDNSIPIKNAAGKIVAYRMGEPEPDPRLDGMSRQAWIMQRSRELVAKKHRPIALKTVRYDGDGWFPLLSTDVPEVVVDKSVIERCVGRTLAGSGTPWSDPALPAGFYLPGGWERVHLEARLSHPGYNWGPWYCNDLDQLAKLIGKSEAEILAVLQLPEDSPKRPDDVFLDDGSLLSDEPDEYWEGMGDLRKLIDEHHRDSYPIPAGITKEWLKWRKKSGGK